MKNNQVSIDPAFVARALGLLAVALIIASTLTQLADCLTGYRSGLFAKLAKVFSADLELNVPNFFAMLLMIFAGLLLALIAILKRKQQARYVLHWAILSLGFFLMAFDEIVSAHEKMVEPLRSVFGGENLGVLYFAWVVPGAALVLFLAFFFLKFWLSLPVKPRLWFLVAGALYVGGAIGMELVGGRYFELHGKDNLTYIFLTTIEESFEITGVIVFIWALLEYLTDTYGEVEMRFAAACPARQNSEGTLPVSANSFTENRPELVV
jgi:hypothetical protein